MTYEFENVPKQQTFYLNLCPYAQFLHGRHQDRLTKKLPSVRTFSGGFQNVETYEDLQEVNARFDGQGIIKTRRFGYDGKGQWRMTPETDLKALLNVDRPAIWSIYSI